MVKLKNVNLSTVLLSQQQRSFLQQQMETDTDTHSQIRLKDLVALCPDRDVSMKSLPHRAQRTLGKVKEEAGYKSHQGRGNQEAKPSKSTLPKQI